jgi:hypothetical protein
VILSVWFFHARINWNSLAEWWYNTSYHTSIKLSPFEALYDYPPPTPELGMAPDSTVAAVNELLKERHLALQLLRKIGGWLSLE